MNTLGRSRLRSASRNTGHLPTSSSSQPTLQAACNSTLDNLQVPSLSQPSPRISKRKKKATVTPIPITFSTFVPCGICSHDCEGQNDVGEYVIGCEGACKKWFHIECVSMSCSTLTELSQSNQKWQCCACRDTPANIPSPVTGLQTTSDESLRWGKVSLTEFEEQLISCYKEIVKWKKNLFMLPSGRAGKEFLTEMKRLVDLFINITSFNHVALNALMVFGPLLLQKPSRSSKSSDHVKYLSKRLTLWKDGDLVTILGEARAIQKRFCKLQPKKDPDHARKVFVRLMLEGEVSSLP